MRILYVINGFDPGGAEHGLLTLVRSGFFKGHELKILGFCRGRGDLAARIAREPNVGELLVACEQEVLTLRGLLKGAAALARVLRDWKPDKVVFSLKQSNIVGRAVLCLFPSVTCISFEHIARYRARRGEWIYGSLLRLLSFRVDEVWADCRETLDATRMYFSNRNRNEHVVPLFVAGSREAAKKRYVLSEPVRLAAAGRLVDRKNVDIILQALRSLVAAGRDLTLDVFGDGPERPSLESLAKSLGVSERVKFHGYKPDWLAEAAFYDMFINLGDTEGFCIVVAEAMLAGLPVVAVDVGGIREYGAHMSNMIKIGAPEAALLEKAIDQILSDETLRRNLGEAASRDMNERYSPSAIAGTARAVLGN